MKFLLVALSLHGFVQAQVLKQNGVSGGSPSFSSVAASTVTITGTGSKCFSVDDPTLVVDCGNNNVSMSAAQANMNASVLTITRPATTDAQSIKFGAGTTDNFAIGRQGSSDKFQMGQINGSGTFVPNQTIDPATGSVGIGTASPATTLDVNGNAQFGSGATKSTFTATGALQLGGQVTQYREVTGVLTGGGQKLSVAINTTAQAGTNIRMNVSGASSLSAGIVFDIGVLNRADGTPDIVSILRNGVSTGTVNIDLGNPADYGQFYVGTTSVTLHIMAIGYDNRSVTGYSYGFTR